MTRRALLIGSETYGLAGCNADVALMHDVLAARRFDTIGVLTDAAASRAGILAGFESLIAAVGPGDAVVVYYSGHGGRVTRPDFEQRKAAGQSVYYQFIVPFDMNDSAPGDFRGVLSEELTVFQRRLTDAFRSRGETPNVTTVLDCCHAGYMARDATAWPKSVDFEPKMFRMLGIREHAQQLGEAAELTGLATNPDVVRIVACEPEQSAFEFESSRGGRHGALTDALATVLDGLGDAPQSWAIIGDLVRRRVSAVVPEQRPEVEGPAERLMFSPESMPVRTALAVTAIGGVPALQAADILGIAAGDEFQLLIPGVDGAVGTAVVSTVDHGNGLLIVTLDPAKAVDPSSIATMAIAVPTRISVPRALVFVDEASIGDQAEVDDIKAAIGESMRIAVGDDRSAAMAVVSAGVGGLAILDPIGAKWRADDFAVDDSGEHTLVQSLEGIAIGQRLRNLASGSGDSALDQVVAVTFGVIEGGVRRPLPLHGSRLTTGGRVFLTMTNTSQEPLYVWVYDIGVSGRSAMLSNAGASGTLLGPAGAEDDTLDLWGQTGQVLYWPADVPKDPAKLVHADPGDITASVGGSGETERARPETFVVLTADRRSDLSALAGPPARARGAVRSPLDMILEEARTGTREVPPAISGERPLRYRLDHVDFLLDPGA